jgi:hypothetical protein
MNFLQICQRTATECGVASGQAITAAMPSVISQVGSLARVINWVGDAWQDIQQAHEDWTWMRSSNILGLGLSFQTVDGQASYPLGVGAGTVGIAVEAFGKWDRDAFRVETTTDSFHDETFLDEIPFDKWRNGYMYGAMRLVKTRPVAIAVGPDRSLNLGPPPNGNYTVTGDYFVAPTAMVANDDLPIGLPTRFHMLIVYIAMQKYAGYESAPEVFQRGAKEERKMYANLLAARAPRLHFGATLA